jgi:transposase
MPLYRQSQMFANEGIDLSGSLMAGRVGKCNKLLERVFEAQAILMDDTTVKQLQKGNGKGKNKVTPKHPSGYRVLGCTFEVRAER